MSNSFVESVTNFFFGLPLPRPLPPSGIFSSKITVWSLKLISNKFSTSAITLSNLHVIFSGKGDKNWNTSGALSAFLNRCDRAGNNNPILVVPLPGSASRLLLLHQLPRPNSQLCTSCVNCAKFLLLLSVCFLHQPALHQLCLYKISQAISEWPSDP